jgi:CheY-like chemotaxis protein
MFPDPRCLNKVLYSMSCSPADIVRHAVIIDDEPLNIEVLTLLLSDSGLTATAIADPDQIPDVLPGLARIDVIFLDLELPQTDGFELLTVLKSNPQLANVPIVAHSVHTDRVNRIMDAGFSGFLGKPLDTRIFPRLLQRILNHEQIWEI